MINLDSNAPNFFWTIFDTTNYDKHRLMRGRCENQPNKNRWWWWDREHSWRRKSPDNKPKSEFFNNIQHNTQKETKNFKNDLNIVTMFTRAVIKPEFNCIFALAKNTHFVALISVWKSSVRSPTLHEYYIHITLLTYSWMNLITPLTSLTVYEQISTEYLVRGTLTLKMVEIWLLFLVNIYSSTKSI